MELEKISGSTQCPFLIDPNTGTQMSESKDIVKYLYKTYATYTPPNELLGSISGFITPVLKPIYKVLAPIQAGSQGDNKAEYQALVDQAKTSIQLEIKSNEVVVYTYALSPFCNEAKSLLNSLNVDFKEISLGKEWIPGLIDKIEGVYKRVALGEMTGQTSLPHIFVNGQSIGGLYEGLLSSLENGTFQQMLKDTKQTKELTPGWMKTIKKETAKEPAIAAKKETDKAPAPATKKKPSKESAKKSEQKAPAEEKKESSDVFDKVVKETFPGAISNDELLTKVVRVLDSKGYTSRNTLLATSLCCDELARALEDDFYEVYGKNFNLGGLAGFPFGGKTAFGAMSAHIPDNGNTLVVFGPHVGITQNGLVGKVERKGIKLVDTCCGSAIAASNYLKGITDGSTAVETQIKSFADFQQNAVKELILPHLTRLMDAENRMVELPYALYDSQNMLLSDIVKGKFDGLKKGTAILGGIQINTGPDSPDYFHPLRFDYIDGNGGASEDLLPLI